MSEAKPQSWIGRSIGAVLAGMVVGIAMTLGTDEVLHITGIFPPWGASMAGTKERSCLQRSIAQSTAWRPATLPRASRPTALCGTPSWAVLLALL